MSTIFSDNFNRADSATVDATNWNEVGPTDWNLASNAVTTGGGGTFFLILTDAAMTNLVDSRVSCRRVSSVGTFDGGPCARSTNDGATMYFLDAVGTNSVTIWRSNSGSDTQIGASASPTLDDNDVYTLEVTGSGATVTLKAYVNATLVLTVTDTDAARITAAGKMGIALFSHAVMDDFLGEDFVQPAEQKSFRFRNDDGSETSATWVDTENTDVSFTQDTNLRLRVLLDTSGAVGAAQYQLEYKKSGETNYEKVITDSSQVVSTISATGAGSFTVPADVYSIDVEGWGGGGAGGRRTSNGGAGGGAGGMYCKQTVTVTPGQIIGYVVGAGATQAATPGAGADTTWNATDLVAKGGPSVASNTATGATAVATTSGTGSTKHKGGDGGLGVTSTNGGGGGSSGGSGADGNSGVAAAAGTAPTGGGAGGAGRAATQGTGTAGSVPGGAGGGALRTAANQNGGSGANGQLKLTYTPVPRVKIAASANIAASAATATTAQLTAPSGKSGNFTAGKISDDTNPLPSITVASAFYTELEWCVQIIGANTTSGDVYLFRVTIAGTAIQTYTNIAQVTIGTSGQTISPGGVTSSEAFGAATLSDVASIAPSGIVSAETFGTATLTPGAVSISPGGIVSAEAFGTAMLSDVASIAPSAIASLEAFGSPTLTPGGVTISPSAIASSETFGEPTLSTVGTLLPSAIDSAETFGAATLTPGGVTISPSAVDSLEAFGDSVFSQLAIIIPSAIDSAEAFEEPALTSLADIFPSAIASLEAFGTLHFQFNQTINPFAIDSRESFGNLKIIFEGEIVITGMFGSVGFFGIVGKNKLFGAQGIFDAQGFNS